VDIVQLLEGILRWEGLPEVFPMPTGQSLLARKFPTEIGNIRPGQAAQSSRPALKVAILAAPEPAVHGRAIRFSDFRKVF
jgi:hypothetical protein